MEPKFILSKNKTLEQYKKAKQLCDTLSYSSKTNPLITKILEKNTDCMFSIHTVNELKNIQDYSRIIFLAQGWKSENILELIKKGIINFVVDNENDLNILLETIKDSDKKINLFLRAKLKENTLKTEKYFVFGMDSSTINKKIKEISTNKKINQIGVHFHRKSQNISEWNLKSELKDIIEEDTLNLINIVNIGGGIPSIYANTNEDAIKSIFPKILKFKKWLNNKNIKLITEPGRFIAAPSVILKTEIINIYDNNIIVNASVYNSNMDALIIPVKLLIKNELKKGKPYVIKGITPCSMDLFRYKVYLDNPKKGDEIIFLNAGAYNFTTNFCSLNEIKTEIVEDF